MRSPQAWADAIADDFAPSAETVLAARETMLRTVEDEEEMARVMVAVCVVCAKRTGRSLADTVADTVLALEGAGT